MTVPLPERVLFDIAWAFEPGSFESIEEFMRAVRQNQIELMKEDSWRPDERVIEAPAIGVSYYGADESDPHEYASLEVELTSDDGRGFTAGELLWKLHIAVTPHLIDADHRYFEGLVLKDPGTDGKLPLYEVQQGS